MPVAIAAVPIEIIGAVALLIAAWAFGVLIAKPIAALLQVLPVVGSELSDRLLRGVGVVQDWAAEQARHGVDVLVQIIAVPVTVAGNIIGAVVGLVTGIVSRIADLFGLIADLTGRVLASVGALAQSIAGVVVRIAQVAASVAGTAADVASTLIAAVNHAWMTAVASLHAALSAAITAEQALIAKVHGDLLAFIVGQVGVVTAAMNATAVAIRAEWGSDLAGVETQLGQLQGLVFPLASAGLLTLVPAIAAELSQLRVKCVDPLCGGLSQALPMFQALQDVATIGIIGGIAGEAIINPVGTARATAAVADEVHTLASDLFGLLTGASA